MAATYEPIATTTISGSSTNSFTFTSIPQTYTDLILVFGNFQGTTNQNFSIRLNGDTGSNYSRTNIEGNGTSVASATGTNQTGYFNGSTIGFPDSKSNGIFHFFNYANTTTYKTMLGRYNYLGSGLPGTGASVGLWRNTSAITSINFFLSVGNYTDGSMATLYGIKAA